MNKKKNQVGTYLVFVFVVIFNKRKPSEFTAWLIFN